MTTPVPKPQESVRTDSNRIQAFTPNLAADTHVPGNSNAGHWYGTDLSKKDKDALIEYLKTL